VRRGGEADPHGGGAVGTSLMMQVRKRGPVHASEHVLHVRIWVPLEIALGTASISFFPLLSPNSTQAEVQAVSALVDS
jgi:hypothetical protein